MWSRWWFSGKVDGGASGKLFFSTGKREVSFLRNGGLRGSFAHVPEWFEILKVETVAWQQGSTTWSSVCTDSSRICDVCVRCLWITYYLTKHSSSSTQTGMRCGA